MKSLKIFNRALQCHKSCLAKNFYFHFIRNQRDKAFQITMEIRNIFFLFLFLNVEGKILNVTEDDYPDVYTYYAAEFWRVGIKHLPKTDNFFYYPWGLLQVLTWMELGAAKDSALQIQQATQLEYDRWKTFIDYYSTYKDPMFSLEKGGYFDGGLRRYLKRSYKDELKKSFNLDVTKFPAYENLELTSSYLNKELEKITHKKIKQFFSSSMYAPNGNGMLYSALYFKGNWESPYNRLNTKEREFKVDSKKKVKVPMMNVRVKLSIIQNYKELGFNLIKIPFEKSKFFLLIIEPTGFSLEKIIAKLGGKEMVAIRNEQKLWENSLHEVNLTLPKFTLEETKHDITLYLMDSVIGIRDIFNEIKADFSNMTSKKDVLAKEVAEASYFGTTETGIEIAGVVNGHLTGNEKLKSRNHPPDIYDDDTEENIDQPLPKLTVDINQPFMFLLFDGDDINVPLAFGKISNPKPASNPKPE